jgi:hypothetical protein
MHTYPYAITDGRVHHTTRTSSFVLYIFGRQMYSVLEEFQNVLMRFWVLTAATIDIFVT